MNVFKSRVNFLFVKQLKIFPSRSFSNETVSNPADIKFLSKEDEEKFNNHLPVLINEMIETKLLSNIDNLNERFTKMVDYTLPFGKKWRPHLLIMCYRFITKDKFDERNLIKLHTLSWCLEMMSQAYLIQDDIVDNSDTRRGKPTWFKRKDVGITAVNDALLLEAAYFQLLFKYFHNDKNVIKIIREFHEMKRTTCIGQILETETKNLIDFTEKRYRDICFNKTGYYTFYSPFNLAALFADKEDLIASNDPEVFNELAFFYQSQNDFLDLWGEKFSGKVGSDIQESRCTRPVLLALEKVTPAQRKILEDNYGSHDSTKLLKVKTLYEDLKILKDYNRIERESKEMVNSRIGDIQNKEVKELLHEITQKIFEQAL